MPVKKQNNKVPPKKQSIQKNNQSPKKKNQSPPSNKKNTKPNRKANPSPKDSKIQQSNNLFDKANNTIEKGSKFLDKTNNTIQNVNNSINKIQKLFGGIINEQQAIVPQSLKIVTKLPPSRTEKLVKAKLIPKDKSATIIEFMFNPTDLQFNRSVEIKDQEGVKTEKGLPKVNFAFVQAWTLKLSNLLFDTYEEGTDVMQEIEPILDAVDFTKFSGDSTAKRPPVYYFTWGEHKYIRCMVNSISYKLTMFLPDGKPVRALVNIDLKEVDDSPTFNIPDPKKKQEEEKQDKLLQNLPGSVGERLRSIIKDGKEKNRKAQEAQKQKQKKPQNSRRSGAKPKSPKPGARRTPKPKQSKPTKPRRGRR